MDSKTKLGDVCRRIIASAALTHDGTAAIQTGWIDVRNVGRIEILVSAAAAITGGVVVTQATSAAGASEKVATAAGLLGSAAVVASDLTIAAASGIVTYDVELTDADMDVDNEFYWISAEFTATAGTAVDTVVMITAYPKDYVTAS